MNIAEIINRQSETIDVEEMIFVVEHYIYKMKGKQVKIVLDSFMPMLYASKVQLLHHAYEWAAFKLRNDTDLSRS